MFEDLTNVFKTVLNLSHELMIVESSGKRTSVKEFFGDLDNFKTTKEHDALYEYFNFLDFETIKILQSIMYLGRDEDYDKDDTPQVIYDKNRKYFDEVIRWKTKEIEINQMLDKSPVLYKYLTNGFKILGIEI
ncbi:MAG: hypothetical protein SA378_11520 [Sedimentibacter sp.]|uniref:hypothetical protein n=1 Tax=Sedimentibacter sp. TaxID=1960295 RepID=UPI0029812E06|nr:hypothetical protein [Sedimentibacter sp.]MDW5300744.1 hypothetical protein [Sedimentibacter sp.]